MVWKTPEPSDLPYLRGVTRVSLDTETSSKNPFTCELVGISIGWRDPNNLDLKTLYCPVGHIEGNMDPEIVRAWLTHVLPGKEVVFANGKFDIRVLKRWGLDLEALGVRPRDVAFPAALLDDSLFIDLSLDGIAKRYVGRGKLPFDGDMNRMASYPAWKAGPYAECDAGITLEADEAMAPLMERDGLIRVAELEYSIMYAVCEIELNGCRLDTEKLHLWRREVRDEYEAIILELKRQTGMLIEPGTAGSMARLFRYLGLTPPIKKEETAGKKKKKKGVQPAAEDKKEKKTSDERVFEVEELLSFKNPILNLVVDARRRESLLSKFLDKYSDGIQGDLLRAQFHQLKTARDEKGKANKGVGWGRFSSSGGGDLKSGYTFNAQQVIRADKQKAELGDAHIIRELFIPDEGYEWGTADAKQIEYRIAAALANAKAIIEAYQDNPDTDYHGFVHEKVKPFRPDIDRTTVKNVDFGITFGATPKTTARTANISVVEAEAIHEFCEGLFPEQPKFLNKCSWQAEHNGFVETIMGRRARFKKGDPYYKAINRVVQGSAADLFKMALRDLYKERKNLGIHKLRQIVHDEFNFDKEKGPESTKRILDFLDQQRFELKIPIRWDLRIGRNWKECK